MKLTLASSPLFGVKSRKRAKMRGRRKKKEEPVVLG